MLLPTRRTREEKSFCQQSTTASERADFILQAKQQAKCISRRSRCQRGHSLRVRVLHCVRCRIVVYGCRRFYFDRVIFEFCCRRSCGCLIGNRSRCLNSRFRIEFSFYNRSNVRRGHGSFVSCGSKRRRDSLPTTTTKTSSSAATTTAAAASAAATATNSSSSSSSSRSPPSRSTTTAAAAAAS